MEFDINADYWKNKKGDLIHKDNVPHEEKLKSEIVHKLAGRAERAAGILTSFKETVTSDIGNFMDMMRDKHKINIMKGTKGNVTLQSFDGLAKVQIAVQTYIDFDEKLTLAKEKLDEFFIEKTEDADPEIKTLIMKVFEVDQKGKLNAKQILSLKSYKIQHPKWIEAMNLIDDAVEIVGSKSYIRFYKRESVDEQFEIISLDFAAI